MLQVYSCRMYGRLEHCYLLCEAYDVVWLREAELCHQCIHVGSKVVQSIATFFVRPMMWSGYLLCEAYNVVWLPTL